MDSTSLGQIIVVHNKHVDNNKRQILGRTDTYTTLMTQYVVLEH